MQNFGSHLLISEFVEVGVNLKQKYGIDDKIFQTKLEYQVIIVYFRFRFLRFSRVYFFSIIRYNAQVMIFIKKYLLKNI